jgi:hypothetical protein
MTQFQNLWNKASQKGSGERGSSGSQSIESQDATMKAADKIANIAGRQLGGSESSARNALTGGASLKVGKRVFGSICPLKYAVFSFTALRIYMSLTSSRASKQKCCESHSC